jgi:amino acid transporter
VTVPSGALLRVLRRRDVVALAINAIIGAGIFGLPSELFARTGTWSLVAFGVCGAAVTLIVVCFAEVGSRYSGTGGPYLYAREAFGSFVGFEVGWLIWIARVTAFAANCNLLVAYLAWFLPAAESPVGRAAVIVLVVVALTALNIHGVRDATLFTNVMTVAKLAALLFFIAVGAHFVEPSRLALGPPPSFGAFSGAVLLMVYAFSGFEMAGIPAGELRDPRRDLPVAILTATGVVVVVYMLIQVVAIGTLPSLAESRRPLADAAFAFVGTPGAALITAGGVVSIFGNLNTVALAGSRVAFAMAERGELPRIFARTHPRFRTPHVAILVTGLVILALTLSGTFVRLATVSVVARLLSYAVTCAALPVLRRSPRAPAALFRVPAGAVVAVTALAVVAWLLSNAAWRQARDAVIVAVVGAIIYRLSRHQPDVAAAELEP